MGPAPQEIPYRVFRLKAIGYAQSVVEGGWGPGGTVALTHASRALGILDKATLAPWIKNRFTYEREVQAATAASGTKASHVPAHPLLAHPLVITPPAFRPGSVHTRSTAIIDIPLSPPLNTILPESGRCLLTLLTTQ